MAIKVASVHQSLSGGLSSSLSRSKEEQKEGMMRDLGLNDRNSSQASWPTEHRDLCTLSILSQAGCIVCV